MSHPSLRAMSSPLHDFPRRPQTPDAKPPSLDALNALRDASHCTGAGRSTRFVHDEPAGDASEGYEERTWRSGEVITRPDNWHDAFNALAWLAYPQTKRALNRLHHEHADSALSAAANARGVARDVLTLFDEDGLLVACADPRLAGLLKNFQWKELFWEQREAVARSMRFHVFGHALAVSRVDGQGAGLHAELPGTGRAAQRAGGRAGCTRRGMVWPP